MGNILYNSLLKKKEVYNERLIRRSIIMIRLSKNKRQVDKHKIFIYDLMSTIIVKNVHNFFNLIKDVEKHRVMHEKDDIVAECFVILDNCVDKFDITSVKYQFFFYFNKALSFGLYRLKKKFYNVHETFNKVDFDKVQNYESLSFTTNNSYPLFLNKNFSNKEILLMQSKLDEEKITDFCKKVEISRNEYYKLMKSIKRKIDKKYFK